MKPFFLPACLSFIIGVSGCSDTGSQPINSNEPIVAKFDIVDSVGQSRRTFRASENATFIYLVVNTSNRPQTWNAAMSYPFARFLTMQSDSIFGDSFYGLAFLAVPIHGNLGPGDTLKSTWRAIGNISPFVPGEYTAVFKPMLGFLNCNVLQEEQLNFSITQ